MRPIRRRRAGAQRLFGTLQDRLVKELALTGIGEIAAANRWIAETFLPEHNRLFARSAALPDVAFVAADRGVLVETLAIEEERVVARDNTVAWAGLRLQIAASPLRAHYVKATVKVRQYPDGELGLFHGPRCIGRFDATGVALPAPAAASVAACSGPSRRGLATALAAALGTRRPSLTAPARAADGPKQAGTKRRRLQPNQETGLDAMTAPP